MQVPSDQSIVSRSEETFEGKPGNGSSKPNMIENVGPVLSFENDIIRGHWINFSPKRVRRERRRSYINGRQQSTEHYDKFRGHHRSRRPGHVFKGVARELERAQCFLVKLKVQEYLIQNSRCSW